MEDYRALSTPEVKGVTTLNCCANAVRDCMPDFGRRFSRPGHDGWMDKLDTAARLIAEVVEGVVTESGDEDQQKMILTRMSRLKLQFGAVRKQPETLVIMTVDDAQTLLAPVLDRCDLECPMDDETLTDAQRRECIKRCETRKALKRIGLSEVGLSMDCPYQMMPGGKDK
jgi:hypothetical protein